jgi:uncharacterized protein YdeI (YjbR/CyaY-like superfamily)
MLVLFWNKSYLFCNHTFLISLMPPTTETFYPKNRTAWRNWLMKNGVNKDSIWVIYYKKQTGKPTVAYTDAVDEALCFGWIDSKAKPIDDEKFMQFFSKRKPKSVWSKVNKEKVERLITEGLMAEPGLQSIAIAKANGSWNILDTAEALEIPTDLEKAFAKYTVAKGNFLAFSRSDKRNILQWLLMAKRPETRQNRLLEIAKLASEGLKPKQFTPKPKT